MGMLTPEQMAQAAASMQVQPDEEELDPSAQPPGAAAPASAPAAGAPGILANVGGQGAPTSDQIPTEALEGMVGAPGGQDPEVEQVIQALEDPNTPPQVKQQIEMMLAMAARRRVAGVES